MNPNPAFGSGAPAGANARDALNVPAILLLVSGALGVLLRLASMVGGGANQTLMSELAKDPRFAQAVAQAGSMSSGPANIAFSLLGIALSGFVIFGALKMRNLQGHGVALGAAIVAIIPCGGCYCIGIPVGIWALVLLLKPEIKSQFQG